MTFLVVDGASEELIIGIESMRSMNLLQHADAVIAVQKGLGLLYSNPSAAEDPPIVDLAGLQIDVESRYGPEAKDLQPPADDSTSSFSRLGKVLVSSAQRTALKEVFGSSAEDDSDVDDNVSDGMPALQPDSDDDEEVQNDRRGKWPYDNHMGVWEYEPPDHYGTDCSNFSQDESERDSEEEWEDHNSGLARRERLSDDEIWALRHPDVNTVNLPPRLLSIKMTPQEAALAAKEAEEEESGIDWLPPLQNRKKKWVAGPEPSFYKNLGRPDLVITKVFTTR